MRFLLELEPSCDLDALEAGAHAAHANALDGVLLRESPELPAPLVAAAALGARVADVLIAAEVELGERHPFEIAEEAAVVDNALAGRLILVVRAAGADYPEALDLLRTALTPRPFRFEGRRWRVPANLPENVHGLEPQVRMTPPPAQVRLEIWGSGDGLGHALERGLGVLADSGADDAALSVAFEHAHARLGPALIGAPRARRERLEPGLLERLRGGRDAFGQDWAVVVGDARAAFELGTRVRPRIQLHRLNPAIEALWEQGLD